MSSVWIVIRDNTYGENETFGVCSTEEKAEAVRTALELENCSHFKIERYEVDSILEACVMSLDEEISQLEELKLLRDKLKGLP